MTRTTLQNLCITINDGALFTSQTAVTLTLTAPPGTEYMQLSSDGGFGGATWEPFASTQPWTLSSYGDYVLPRSVYARFNTNGQVSSVYQDDIVLDQTPPTGGVLIENVVAGSTAPGEALLSTQATTTTTHTVYLPMVVANYNHRIRPVRLLFSATDDVRGVRSMIVSSVWPRAPMSLRGFSLQMTW